MKSQNSEYTCRSSGDLKNFPRWYSTRIRSQRYTDAAWLMPHSIRISSAQRTRHPHSTHDGASSRDAKTSAACSMGLSVMDGSRFIWSYRPTCPRMIWPTSCAMVKRIRSTGRKRLIPIYGTPSMTVLTPSRISSTSSARIQMPR